MLACCDQNVERELIFDNDSPFFFGNSFMNLIFCLKSFYFGNQFIETQPDGKNNRNDYFLLVRVFWSPPRPLDYVQEVLDNIWKCQGTLQIFESDN
ncbi:hypothetical protein LINPERPRIM_LOCUS38504 [Linum perenne]